MNNILMCISCVLATLLLNISSAYAFEDNSNFSFGVGIGPMYSGLGINAAYQSTDSIIYGSLGCVDKNSDDEACGLGIGYLNSTILNLGNKHALGAYVGIVGSEITNHKLKENYGVNFSYNYFFKGISHSGANVGVGISFERNDDDIDPLLSVQIGYQF
ncbi:MAG: hypothetical protein ACJA0T_000987 [Colwellia sp.]|jgi:hypothetical protein